MSILTTPETQGGSAQENPRTVGEAIRRHAELRPRQSALVGSDFEPVSYKTLQGEIESVRAALRAAGLGREARIAVAIANSAQAARAIISVTCSAAAVPIDPKLTVAEVERCLLILRPSAVLVLGKSESAARTAAEQRGFPVIEAHFSPDLTLEVPQIGAPAPLDEPDPEAPAFILHTSGTTADPNLVPFSHRNMMAVIERLKTWYGLTAQDRCLNVSPVYYSHALTTTILPPLMTGGSVAFPANPTNVDLTEWFASLSPTWYSAGPTLHLSVLEKAEQLADARTMHSLRFMSSAGAPIAREVHQRIQNALGVPVLEHYGSSETAQIASNRPTAGGSKVGTCGIPWPDIVKIADDDGQPVQSGERGEVYVRGPSVMAGYLNAPERNKTVFVDGWYRTGDIGSLDADGFLTLHGREKELINRGGEKIAPLEIDQALMKHPQVAQAAAFGVPHPRLGEDVAAAVVLHDGATVTPAELREFISEDIASFKVPRRITIVDQLPKGITGKVQRKRLSEALRDKPQSGGLSDQNLHDGLLALWKRVLKVDDLSLDDDFFEKGGDSLLAMDVSLELQKLTGKELPESILFEAPTIRDLAKRLTEETA
jgi:acyl-CoA synthetase (AMP-forming)/AMP-acid ligase II/acyl carrier protein